MPLQRFQVSVIETRAYSRTYIVEARSTKEAQDLAGKGETVHESDGILVEITKRELTSTPKPIHDES